MNNNFSYKVACRYLINWIVSFVHGTRLGRNIHQEIITKVMLQKDKVCHRGHVLHFSVPNKLNDYRVKTFATKEPDTLEWIESIPTGSFFWDIGANIGLYSIYAAISRNCNVVAFEPSVFNLELLARNIALNELQDRISIFPIALSDKVSTSMFAMSNTDWGGALSTFGQNFDQYGEPLKQVFRYKTHSLSMDDVFLMLKIPKPQYLKIDVDGIEHFILRGGTSILAEVDSVLIELNDTFTDQVSESKVLLENAGLFLHKKCDLSVSNQYNQWWIRSSSTTVKGI